ncbi:hypothetical protein PGT21_033585 [Puccinia graminis f. sp. tritici]|uniref:Uncharacterized protein n=2 Tax=Puccinia graminis f. sp. tritici TaxID=56615 RepID=E3KHB9_PUCGT|nr:uncharacterized protein PGTG_09407 [Puccinia graminis f. sp. tritici CRL 75-36-700-3]EFP83694.2 hypothetical protein PGTG_09407 [Puccinia graminis f. sp. tritici CRL 75-36-700-3]KAA1087556.1 hypothetical protein PGT21_033585 [Puccinia graminis f. sp. tritici]KAA1138372.1 hypothetical protein PGTUg99_033273 [Puccinia graminis f. sp. tritici]
MCDLFFYEAEGTVVRPPFYDLPTLRPKTLKGNQCAVQLPHRASSATLKGTRLLLLMQAIRNTSPTKPDGVSCVYGHARRPVTVPASHRFMCLCSRKPPELRGLTAIL